MQNTVADYIRALLASERFARQVTHHRVLPAREARYGETRRPWPRAVAEVLRERGIASLYSHQALTADNIRAGRDVVVATPTASGKTLCYSLPILEKCLQDPDSRALMLFPLKALAQDQLAAFGELTAHWPEAARPSIAIYDGDTTDHFRRKIRKNPPNVLITNPEMLHLAILPFHQQWTTFLASLSLVVVDEAHTYRGVLGSHISQLFRRLNRVCARYAARPNFVFCTATVGNPEELAANLLGREWAEEGTALSEGGFSPSGQPLSSRVSLPETDGGAGATPTGRNAPQPREVSEKAGDAPGTGSGKAIESGPPETVFSAAGGVPPFPAIPVIRDSGAPTGRRHMVFIDPEDSPSTTAIALLKAALARGLRTIVYCRSRRMTELIALWAADKAGSYAGRISAYRAGFLPEERREIEARMSDGQLLAVVTTSALELGIDIGNLDVCILVGYPGTVISTLQRGGRVGRSGQESAVLLVAGEDALDQYFIHKPEAFFEREPERAVVNPDNDVIVKRHLECAAAELPLACGDPWLRGPGARAALRELEREGLLLKSADGGEWIAARKRPQRHVDLRGCGASCTIVDAEGKPIGSVDGHQAYKETHPGAVYLHRGKTYVVKSLDMAERLVRCEVPEQRVNWHTRVRSHKETAVIEVKRTGTAFGSPVAFGRLRVTETITGYERRSVSDNRLLCVVPLDLPPLVFETEGLWFCVPDGPRRETEDNLMHFMGSIHALEHASIGLMPLMVMADRNDFGGISTPMHAQLGLPAVFVYDGLPGGAGLCRSAFPRLAELFAAVRDLLRRCPCELGCPSCVHSPKCGSGNRPIDKAGALFLLERLIAAPPPEGDMLVSGLEPETREKETMAVEVMMGEASGVPTARVPAPLPGRYMVLDVETRRSAAEVGGWNRADRMGVSVAVLYDSQGDGFIEYEQDALPDLFARLREADLVIGFNSSRFDYAVLQPFAGYDLRSLPTLDMLVEVKKRLSYRVSLDNLARATLNAPKSADGLQALQWWKEGNLAAIAEYCRKDVEITRDVYLFGHREGYLLFTNKAGQAVRIAVEW